MANSKISDLGAVTTPLAGTEELPIVQSATTKKVTADELVRAGSWVRIGASQIASADTSIDFTTGINSTYDMYEVEIIDVNLGTTAGDLAMRVSDDAGVSFKAGVSDYDYHRTNLTLGSGATFANDDNAAAAQLDIGPADNVAGAKNHTMVRFTSPDISSLFTMRAEFYRTSGTAVIIHGWSMGNYNTAAVINAIQFVPIGGGTIGEGIFSLYGRKK